MFLPVEPSHSRGASISSDVPSPRGPYPGQFSPQGRSRNVNSKISGISTCEPLEVFEELNLTIGYRGRPGVLFKSTLIDGSRASEFPAALPQRHEKMKEKEF